MTIDEKISLKIDVPERSRIYWDGIEGMKFWENGKNGYHVAVCHFTADPKKRTMEWFLEETKNLTQDKIDQEYHINFEAKSGRRAFPYLAMNPSKWLVEPREISKKETIIVSIDFGSRNPTAILFAAVDHRGRFHFFDEFYKPSNPAEIARFIKNHPFYRRITKIVADPSIFNNNQHNQDGSVRSIKDLIEDAGIYGIEPGVNDRIAGLERMKMMLRFNAVQDLEPYMTISKNCKKLWWELINLTYKENTDNQRATSNEPEDVVKKNDHGFDSCFESSVEVTTDFGRKPICKILPGEKVLTRLGYRKVISAGKTGTKQTSVLVFSNGRSIECTGCHPFYTKNRGFVSADDLRYDDIVLTEEECQSRLNSTESFLEKLAITTGQMGLIVKEALNLFIVNFGSTTMGRFQTDFMSTTKMVIQTITQLKTLKLFRLLSTCLLTQKNSAHDFWSTLRSYRKKPRSGTEATQEENGTLSTLSRFGAMERKLRKFVKTAKSNSRFTNSWQKETDQSFAETHVGQQQEENLVPMTLNYFVCNAAKALRKAGMTKRKPVAGFVVGLLEKRPGRVVDVYNLSVAGLPEFFANGILVHNCRYSLMSWTVPSELPDASEGRRGYHARFKDIEDEIDDHYRDLERADRLL